ncbi:MAG: hypothetical protein K9W43_04890 [Candidatus Thorarchaeota archaeon]|nr:hypothetical protein [Candidatus Thorarchaeota archaeon]
MAEKYLEDAEREFLTGTDGVAESLLARLAGGTFASDVEVAREIMQNLDESHYIKWDRWERRYEFSVSSWKDAGYPNIDATTLHAGNPDWYSERVGTTTFVKDLMVHRSIVAPTIDGDRKGPPTPKGAPANKWLLDFVVLSSLRFSFKHHWEKLVRDIVWKRATTDLNLVAAKLGLTVKEVLAISHKIRDLDDRVIEFDVTDDSNNLTYHCKNPQHDLAPLVDIDD